MKLEVNIGNLKRQKELLLSGKPSYLGIGMENYTVEPLLDEPNYDLIPKSEHGRLQTGEVVEDVGTITIEAAPVDKARWLDNPEVVEKFKALADLKNRTLTKAGMKATAEKYESQEALLIYLDNQLSSGSHQAQQ